MKYPFPRVMRALSLWWLLLFPCILPAQTLPDIERLLETNDITPSEEGYEEIISTLVYLSTHPLDINTVGFDSLKMLYFLSEITKLTTCSPSENVMVHSHTPTSSCSSLASDPPTLPTSGFLSESGISLPPPGPSTGLPRNSSSAPARPAPSRKAIDTTPRKLFYTKTTTSSRNAIVFKVHPGDYSPNTG